MPGSPEWTGEDHLGYDITHAAFWLMLRVSTVRIGTPEDGNPSRNRAEKAMRICVSVSPPTSVDSYACEYQRRAARTIVHTNSVASEHRTQPRTSTRLVARDVAVHQHLV